MTPPGLKSGAFNHLPPHFALQLKIQDFCTLISLCYLTVQSWLLSDPHMKPRSLYPPFVQAGDQYLKALLPIVSPLQVMY